VLSHILVYCGYESDRQVSDLFHALSVLPSGEERRIIGCLDRRAGLDTRAKRWILIEGTDLQPHIIHITSPAWSEGRWYIVI
jgi:hypothetical protein